jgi:hypothetical protein
MLAKRGRAGEPGEAFAHRFVSARQVLLAVFAEALGALAPAFLLTGRDAAPAVAVAYQGALAKVEVLGKVDLLVLTNLPYANLLGIVADAAVQSAERPAAVLAHADGSTVATCKNPAVAAVRGHALTSECDLGMI